MKLKPVFTTQENCDACILTNVSRSHALRFTCSHGGTCTNIIILEITKITNKLLFHSFIKFHF